MKRKVIEGEVIVGNWVIRIGKINIDDVLEKYDGKVVRITIEEMEESK